MHMPVIALVGSASYAMKRPRTKLASKSSFWLTTMLFSLTALTARNGCFVPAVRSHTTLNVSLLTVNNRYKAKDGPSLAPSMNVRVPKVKQVNPSRSTPRSPSWSLMTNFYPTVAPWLNKSSRRKGKVGRCIRHLRKRGMP